jgi:hypothetical protein
MEILLLTKMFVTNLVLFMTAIIFDKYVLDDALERGRAAVGMALWSVVTVLSIPAYIVSLVWLW